jgi:hypothetical protein
MAALITHLCASTCAFTWMVIEWLHLGKPSIVGDDLSFAFVLFLALSMVLIDCCIVLASSFPQASPQEL